MLPTALVPGSRRRRQRRAFTPIEIVIVLFLLVLILGVAVPSFSGQMANHQLQTSFDRFETLVAEAQRHSVAEHRPYALVWARDGSVGLYPADLPAAGRKKQSPAAALPAAGSPPLRRDERYSLVRDASLSDHPADVWTFWPTGNCEPVGVRYEGPHGHWEAVYNPLSVRADLRSFIVR